MMRRCAIKYLRHTARVHKPTVRNAVRGCTLTVGNTVLPKPLASANVPRANEPFLAAEAKGAQSALPHKAELILPTPTALFGSFVGSYMLEPEDVVALLLQVRTNMEAEPDNEMATNTRHVINRTIPLLRIGDRRGKQQAVILFALLINGADHCNKMRRLKEALSPTLDEADSAVAARFQKFLDSFARADTPARVLIEQASEQNIYNVTGLEELISRERVNVLTYLEQKKKLLKSNFFKGRKIWRLTDDKSFERHIEVELMAQDETVESVRRIMRDRAALLYGESGSGKTSTAILSCEEGDLCIFMTPKVFANKAEMNIFNDLVKADQMKFANAVKRNTKKDAANPVIPEQPGALCEVLTKYICKAIPYFQSLEEYNGNVVLVVDEVGSHPLLVRALCREHSSIVSLVKKMLNVTGSVGLVVCGTGCESGDSLGSNPSTFEALRCEPKPFQEHVVELMAKKGFVALAELLKDKEPTRASYYYKMSIDSKSVVYVQRLMLNRRFCAALLRELRQSFSRTTRGDGNIPWLTVLPVLVSAALLGCKGLNALESQAWDATLTLFARALAYCYGGPKQAIDGANELQRKFGMITDNARECPSDRVDVLVSTYANGAQLALPKGEAHFGRRVQMSPAMTEMGLQRFSLRTVARARMDDALETTVTDWIYCWCLACCSDVPTITLLGEESGTIHAVRLAQDVDENDAAARQALLTVMMRMRDALRAPQRRTAVVLRVSLTEKVESVSAAEEVAFAEAWALIGEADVPFVLVARNAPKASFAALFVVAGRTRAPSANKAATPTTTLFVAIQMQHHTKESFPLDGVETEHSRHGAHTPRATGTFISLVLAVHPDTLDHCPSSDSPVNDADVKTTVRIRRGALASVMHPITLGAEQEKVVCSRDSERYDLRNSQ